LQPAVAWAWRGKCTAIAEASLGPALPPTANGEKHSGSRQTFSEHRSRKKADYLYPKTPGGGELPGLKNRQFYIHQYEK